MDKEKTRRAMGCYQNRKVAPEPQERTLMCMMTSNQCISKSIVGFSCLCRMSTTGSGKSESKSEANS